MRNDEKKNKKMPSFHNFLNGNRRKTYLKILNLQAFVEIEHDYHKITVLSIMNAYGLQWYVISENIQTDW